MAPAHRDIIVAVDPAVVGMSRLADLLEASPFLPSRMALRQQLDITRRELHGEVGDGAVGVVVPSTQPGLVVYAHLLHAERVALYHTADIALSPAQRSALRAAFAVVDLCLVPDAAAEQSAAKLGADPDRLARLDEGAAARLFAEPPRKPLRKAAFEMGASLALDAAEAVGAISALERLSPDQGVNVVNYHRVLPLPELRTYGRPQMALAAPIFEAQLEAFAARRGFAPLDQIHDADARGRVSVTFDDGYEDNARVALPILQRFSTPACIFVVTNLIGHPEALWWDRVGLALFAWWRALQDPELSPAPERAVPAALPERAAGLLETHGFGAARALISEVLSDLNRASEAERATAVDAAEALVPPTETAGRTMLTWDELQTLAEAGVTFGAHTRNHVPLDELPRDAATEELMGSQADLEAKLGRPAYKTCALPRGRLGELTEADLSAGFDSVMTTDPGVHDPADRDLFVKRRDGRMLTLAGRHHPAKLRLELSGWVDRLRAAYQARAGAPD